jgi:predicted PurR-regulated permease PerM
MTELRPKLEQHLATIALALLALGCLWIMLPFVTAMLWASVLSFSVWPLYRRLLKFLHGRRTLASLIVSLGMVCAILLPFVIVGMTLADNVDQLTGATRRLLDAGLPAAPQWLAKVPFVGSRGAEYWQDLAADSTKLAAAVKPLLEPVGRWALAAGLAIGYGLLQLALSILIAFFLLRDGGAVVEYLAVAMERIAGPRGRYLLELAGNTVRGVVYGILGTALVQALMAGVGLFVAGVPGAALLALLTFFLSVIPCGPPLVMVPAALWLFSQGSTGWGIFMLIWGAGVSTIDNFVKPWLISQGSAMPFVLILLGVAGGALAFGFIGIFIGPTLLAVGYRLVREWTSAGPDAKAGVPAQGD